MKKKLVIGLTVFVLILIPVILISINTDLKKVERRLDLELPSNAELTYYDNNIGWFGEGGIYSVIQFDDKSNRYIIDLFQELALEGDKPYPIETDNDFEEKVDHALSTFVGDVPEEYRPNFTHSYVWKYSGNDIYWIFDQETYELFIVEVVW